MAKKINLIVILCVLSLYSCARHSRVSGRLTENSIWSGKVILEGDIYIPEGITLTVLAGTEIMCTASELKNEVQRLRNNSGATYDMFSPGIVDIIVNGNIDMQGTASRPVLFLSSPKSRKKHSGGITFIGQAEFSKIINTVITGAEVAIRVFDDRHPFISTVTAAGNSVGAIGCWNRAAPIIEHCTILENKYGIGASDIASPIIKDTIVKNNSASGIFFEGQSRGEVVSCEVRGNNVGIACGDEALPKISFSTITANGSGIGCWKKSSPKITNNNFKSNIVGILALDDSKVMIKNNFFRKNGGAITVSDRATGNIQNNDMHGSGPAIVISAYATPRIFENYISGNTYGIMVENRAHPQIYANKFIENRVGILLKDYSKAKYKNNVFKENSTKVVDSRWK